MEPIYEINANATYEKEIKALQDTDFSCVTGTFNQLFETTLNNVHAVKNEVEELGSKIKWKEYTSLLQLELTEADIVEAGTLAVIVERLPNYSIFRNWSSDAISRQNMTPAPGLLTIMRFDDNYSWLELKRVNGNTALNHIWFCEYRSDGGGEGFTKKVSAWKRLVTEDEIRDTGWINFNLINGFRLYQDGSARYRKIGKMVTIQGIISPPSNSTINSAISNIFSTIPLGFRPSQTTHLLCQGSDKNSWLLSVTPAGNVRAARYGQSGKWASEILGTEWMPFDLSYLVE